MNILMLTNTFTPHVGGVARSVESFVREYRRLGHRVMVIAPEFERMPRREKDVVRVPAIQHFNGSDFSVVYPFTDYPEEQIEIFKPDVVHSHHPFLLGNNAVRIANQFGAPLVFTHHTMYEQYTHYVPGDSTRMKQFAINLAIGYCNLCDTVVAPSESVARLLHERGVKRPIEVIPTGVYDKKFGKGNRSEFRKARKIPRNALVVGHLGRLAPEKNLPFLAEAVARYLKTNDQAVFLLVGTGPSLPHIKEVFKREHLTRRLIHVPRVKGQKLIDAYHAMDLFAFASQSETQGMVLTEAMAAGVPVVAVDASGAREVVRDGVNGRLLPRQDMQLFVEALADLANRTPAERRKLKTAARQTGRDFSMDRCAKKALRLYEQLRRQKRVVHPVEGNLWESALSWLRTEWNILANVAEAATNAMVAEDQATSLQDVGQEEGDPPARPSLSEVR